MNIVHKTLPQDLTKEELADWLKKNATEQFTDEIKNYFTPEDIAEFEHESSLNGRTKNKLDALLAEVSKAIKKGIEDDPLIIEIPVSIGTELAEKQRRQNDDFIDKGYEIEETEVFGVVNTEDETMEFVTIEGKLVAERTRGLTSKEKVLHLGLRNINMTPRDAAANE